jgi:hypothetical protein
MVIGYARNRQQPRFEVPYTIAVILEISVKDLIVEKNYIK